MLHNNGLTKLSEECGELVQAIAKYTTLKDEKPSEVIHWDGSNVKERLQDEIADVTAAIFMVIEALELDDERTGERAAKKLDLFRYWHQGGTETALPKSEGENG